MCHIIIIIYILYILFSNFFKCMFKIKTLLLIIIIFNQIYYNKIRLIIIKNFVVSATMASPPPESLKSCQYMLQLSHQRPNPSRKESPKQK